jgi:ribosomal protein L7/L12
MPDAAFWLAILALTLSLLALLLPARAGGGGSSAQIERLERRMAALTEYVGMAPDAEPVSPANVLVDTASANVLGQRGSVEPDPALSARALALLGRGQKIEAIKLYRRETGLGLKEAKDAVEAIERGQR